MAAKGQMTLAEFAEKHPEYCSKPKRLTDKSIRWLCQCKCGNVFDYRERIKFEEGCIGFAPCQGRCPRCGSIGFSFIGSGANVYPIRWNFTG